MPKNEIRNGRHQSFSVGARHQQCYGLSHLRCAAALPPGSEHITLQSRCIRAILKSACLTSRHDSTAGMPLMSLTMDLGRRIELVSMDPHFHDISIALYRQETESGPQYVVHSYSQKEGTRERLAFVIRAMHVLGVLEENNGRLYFSCGSPHQLAASRIFLDAIKLKALAILESRQLSILDKKSKIEFEASSAGLRVYKV